MTVDKEELEEKIFRIVRLPLKFMPSWLSSIGAGVFISEVVEKNPRLKERLKELKGKVFLFEVKDMGKKFYLSIEGGIEGGELKVIPHMSSPPDVVMSGDARVLFDLFLGRVDADTVFFSRRLEISGDTAAGIHLKNILA